jgi:phosphoenolpyruvate carboxykinase (ATP)
MAQHNTTAWLINTGWTGGGYGVGSRMKLSQTRAIIQAIHAGELAQVETVRDEVFGLAMPKSCPGVPEQVLQPRHAWADPVAYDAAAQKLAKLFFDNFRHYAAAASEAILSAGPKISAGVGAK